MNDIEIFTLKVLRKLYAKTFHPQLPELKRETNPDRASDMVYNLLSSDKPCMIARFGAFELTTLLNYLSIKSSKHSVLKYIRGEEEQWWWNKKLMGFMCSNAGFFPPTEENLSQFCELMLKDISELDMLGSWVKSECLIKEKLSDLCICQLLCLEPYWSSNPWSRVLEGKNVLVVHPFAELIEKQYKENRTHLFKNPNVLPLFNLKTIKAVQSLGGQTNGFNNWFEALAWMETEMDKTDYDIALIGCGAYGFSLAAHAKRSGKKAVLLGGALQLLFGIRGKRWENPDYGYIRFNKKNVYNTLFNEYWTRAGQETKSSNSNAVEGGCYW